MDERGTTPERAEFENSVDFTEEEVLSEIDEDEWTDRNFGASNADNTSDEATDLRCLFLGFICKFLYIDNFLRA